MMNSIVTANLKRGIELKYINKEDLKFFKEILTAETIGKKEYLIKDTLLNKLDLLGFNCEVDDIGNISAIRGKSDDYAMLNAHMDIVNNSYYNSYSSYKPVKEYNSSFSSKFGSSFFDRQDISAEYDNDYYFYSEVYDIIVDTKEHHTIKEEYHAEVIDSLAPYLVNLGLKDISNMNLDCMCCKGECKNYYICDNFQFHLEGERTIETFLDNLEDYVIKAAEELSEYEDGYYDEEEVEEEIIDSFDDESNEHKEVDYEVIIDLVADKIKGKGKPRVLGGDDKCGIFIALKVAEMLPDIPLKILFTVQEETGCIGINHFVKNNEEFFEDVKYSLTIDRRDKDNLLWSQLGTRSCDDNFAAKLSREGVKEGIPVRLMDGSVADVIYIRDHVPNSVNMSAGYYSAHSKDEYIIPSDVDRIVGWVRNILVNV